jgi:hypothetical protein
VEPPELLNSDPDGFAWGVWHAAWSAWGAGLFGRPWLDAPFLWSESYFYRRLLDATGFFGPGPWR